jgi:hypothetical protein
MKKMMVVMGTLLVFVLTTMTCYAIYTKKTITPADLPTLKGKWSGDRVVGTKPDKYLVDLEINNDKLPLKGKMTLHKVIRAGVKDRTEVIGLGKSEIKDGNLVIKAEKVIFELSLYAEGDKMKLEGDYTFQDLRGTLSVYKK